MLGWLVLPGHLIDINLYFELCISRVNCLHHRLAITLSLFVYFLFLIRFPFKPFPFGSQHLLCRSLLQHFTFAEHETVVRSSNSFQPVSNCDYSALLHLLVQDLLDLHSSLHIDTRGCLVQNDDGTPAKDSPSEANKLTLTLTEIAASSIDRCIERPTLSITDAL